MAKDSKKVVLIVDDTEMLLRAFERALGKFEEVEVIAASSPEEALAKLNERIRDIDLIMLDGDLGVGVTNGAELAEQMLAAGYTGMMMGMSSDDDMNTLMMHSGCRDSVRKENMVAKVISFLRLD